MMDKSQGLPLRDIHLPQELGWWPPAVGWWLLAALSVVLVYSLYRAYRFMTRKTATTEAVKALNRLKADKDISAQEKIRQLSCLLRRLAMSTSEHSEVAGLHGMAWLHYLDQSMPGTPFTQGQGRILADRPFRSEWAPAEEINSSRDVEQLMQLSEHWIKAQR